MSEVEGNLSFSLSKPYNMFFGISNLRFFSFATFLINSETINCFLKNFKMSSSFSILLNAFFLRNLYLRAFILPQHFEKQNKDYKLNQKFT